MAKKCEICRKPADGNNRLETHHFYDRFYLRRRKIHKNSDEWRQYRGLRFQHRVHKKCHVAMNLRQVKCRKGQRERPCHECRYHQVCCYSA